MAQKDLPHGSDAPEPLTTPAALDRLLAIMARWWEGWGLTRIGREHGLSRQRIAVLLSQAGCTRALWTRADHDRPDSRRRATADRVANARQALRHPLAGRLIIRQRAALAWQAQGLVLVDIARRMRTSPQNVLHLQVAGRWRLQRLSQPKRSRATDRRAVPREEPGPMPASNEETPALNWDDLMPHPGRLPTNDRTGQDET